MLRRTRCSCVKLIIVESPNKVGNITKYASAIKDLSFGRPDAPASSSPGEAVMVKATIGHFMVTDEVTITQKNPLPGKAPDAIVPASNELTTASDCFEFRPTMSRSPEKANRIDEIVQFIQQQGPNLSEVILASDPDREGELIAEHTLDMVKKAAKGNKQLTYSRAYMQAITDVGVEAALKTREFGKYDKKLASAASTRHTLDRLFGFFGSAMMQTVNSTLKSVGRVQTPALILVHDREAAHDDFIAKRKSSFGLSGKASIGSLGTAAPCTISLEVPVEGQQVKAKKPKGKAALATATVEETAPNWWSPASMEAAKALSDVLATRASTFSWTAKSSGKPTKRTVEPPQPLTLQALMLIAGRKFKMSSEDVMKHCQQLFTEGLITYPRTDSVRIDSPSLNKITDFVAKTYGATSVAAAGTIAERLSGEKVKGKGKKKTDPSNAEDAHEALHPTNVAADPATLRFASAEGQMLYEEIRNVTLAAVMVAQEVETSTCIFRATLPADMCRTVKPGGDEDLPPPGTEILCRVTASKVVVAGFTSVLREPSAATEGGPNDATDGALYKLMLAASQGDVPSFALGSIKAVERKAAPPPLFFEGSLIEELKQHGIGRPSTYASILTTLKQRGYVVIEPSTGRMRTSPLGKELVSAAKRYFPVFVDLGFTSRMEACLDGIANGKQKPDSLASAVWYQLLQSAPEVARSSYFKDAADRATNAAKIAAVNTRVTDFTVTTAGGASVTLSEACARVRGFLRRQGKF